MIIRYWIKYKSLDDHAPQRNSEKKYIQITRNIYTSKNQSTEGTGKWFANLFSCCCEYMRQDFILGHFKVPIQVLSWLKFLSWSRG